MVFGRAPFDIAVWPFGLLNPFASDIKGVGLFAPALRSLGCTRSFRASAAIPHAKNFLEKKLKNR
jgi:hypothetical protein